MTTQTLPLQTFSSIPILSESECQSIRTELYELRKHWIQRHPYAPFYTLGAASYLDAVKDVQAYYQKAEHYNELLSDRLAWLYERLSNVLYQHLEAPVDYPHSFALPGFHIYLSCVVFQYPVASIHIDSQYQHLHWNTSDTDFTRPISFTLTISLPKSGGGLNVWDIDRADLLNGDSSNLQRLLQTRTKTFYPYQVGTLIIHSGQTLHQVAPSTSLQPEDDRITLQGHALFSQGQWKLYW